MPGTICRNYLAVAQKTGAKMGCPGKWTHGPKPAVCPSSFILSHIQIDMAMNLNKDPPETNVVGGHKSPPNSDVHQKGSTPPV